MDEGEIVTIIGPNGCGKSTLMKAVVGLVRVKAGAVTFRGTDISAQPPERIVRTGLCYVPQSANVFPSLSIRENLEMGGFVRNERLPGADRGAVRAVPGLGAAAHAASGQPVGRAAADAGHCPCPDAWTRCLLLLDEPSAGLSPAIMDLVFERIRGINRAGVALLLVEQNARESLRMSDRGYVLAAGRNRLEDSGPALLDNPEVARASI